MKPFRNIYTLFAENPNYFIGELEIPYTGELTYGVKQLPEDFDENQDIYYKCSCDLKEYKCFKKV
jgi:hypothetical protein